MRSKALVAATIWLACGASFILPANASPFFFSTGNPNGLMAAASRPGTAGNLEIETGDDFVVANDTASITSATFTGLITGTTPTIGGVTAEIYNIFPVDSNTGRTPNVPTRVNSPSDVALTNRSSGSNLTFTTSVLNSTFSALNSVAPGGIHASPMQTTGGNGPVTGEEVQFHLTFTTPIDLPAGHYFFVPQVDITGGNFFWLSAPKPIVPPGTPFPAGTTDLQGWTRDQFLDPDWLRVGGDIVGPTPATGPTFNFSFSLEGDVVPLPATLPLFATGLGAMGWIGWRRKRKAQAVA